LAGASAAAEKGALPPLGSLLATPMLLDPEVLGHETVVFAAGVETESITPSSSELLRDEPVTIIPLSRRDQRATEEPISQ
jgi:prolyl-tRNA editing enzyme YbaK/EbsC (Cys-tRNA(Pro) deacylase)